MPATAREPSGTRVLVLCGQPLQNQGCAVAGAGHLSSASALPWPHDGQARVHARGDVAGHAQLLQALGNGLGDERRRQVGLGAQQPVPLGLGMRPFAAECRPGLVELAQHVGAHVGAPVVQLFLELVFDDLALFLHHQDLLQPGGEVARDGGFQRPHHVDLVQADAQLAAGVVVQPQVTSAWRVSL
jgi:hypothetical protein